MKSCKAFLWYNDWDLIAYSILFSSSLHLDAEYCSLRCGKKTHFNKQTSKAQHTYRSCLKQVMSSIKNQGMKNEGCYYNNVTKVFLLKVHNRMMGFSKEIDG